MIKKDRELILIKLILIAVSLKNKKITQIRSKPINYVIMKWDKWSLPYPYRITYFAEQTALGHLEQNSGVHFGIHITSTKLPRKWVKLLGLGHTGLAIKIKIWKCQNG